MMTTVHNRKRGECGNVDRPLLVADGSWAGECMVEGLRAKGYQVVHVDNVERALAAVRQTRPNVVVTELRLGGSSGFRLLRQLRELNADIDVIVITAFGSIEAALAAIQLGARDFLCKPVTVSEVLLAAALIDETGGNMELPADASMTLEQASEQYISETLKVFSSIRKAAQVLGVDRRSLRRRMVRYASLARCRHERPYSVMDAEPACASESDHQGPGGQRAP